MDPVELPIEETVRLKKEHDAAVEKARRLKEEVVNEVLQTLTPEVLEAIAPCELIPRTYESEDECGTSGLFLSGQGTLYIEDEDRRFDIPLRDIVLRFELKAVLRGLERVFKQTNKGRKKAIANLEKEQERLEEVLQLMGSYQ